MSQSTSFSGHDENNFYPTAGTATAAKVCKCTSNNKSRALGAAAADALSGTVAGFPSASDRLDAHNAGLSALLTQDWDTLMALSRTTWSTFLDDLAAIATWVDRS